MGDNGIPAGSEFVANFKQVCCLVPENAFLNVKPYHCFVPWITKHRGLMTYMRSIR
jgi:hypothetical protein